MAMISLHRCMGFIVLLLACLACLVHSAPLEHSARALKTGKSHPLEILRFNLGTENEHWALFIPDGPGLTKGSVVDAHYVKRGNQIFQTRIYGPLFSDIARYNSLSRTVVGTVIVPTSGITPTQAMGAVSLTKPPPTQNCVDWTSLAAGALFKGGYIDKATHTKIMAVYNAEVKAVKQLTLPAYLAIKDNDVSPEPGCRRCTVS